MHYMSQHKIGSLVFVFCRMQKLIIFSVFAFKDNPDSLPSSWRVNIPLYYFCTRISLIYLPSHMTCQTVTSTTSSRDYSVLLISQTGGEGWNSPSSRTHPTRTTRTLTRTLMSMVIQHDEIIGWIGG